MTQAIAKVRECAGSNYAKAPIDGVTLNMLMPHRLTDSTRTLRPEHTALVCIVLAALGGCGSTEPSVGVPVPATAVSVATAFSMSCALSSTAHAFCWGKDS